MLPKNKNLESFLFVLNDFFKFKVSRIFWSQFTLWVHWVQDLENLTTVFLQLFLSNSFSSLDQPSNIESLMPRHTLSIAAYYIPLFFFISLNKVFPKLKKFETATICLSFIFPQIFNLQCECHSTFQTSTSVGSGIQTSKCPVSFFFY